MTALFISDLHLYPLRPAVTAAFAKFLQEDATQVDDLYILGDLFEAWIGDDDPDPHNRSIVDALKALTDSGTRCHFIAGNRDFLVGQKFAAASGVELLADGTEVDLYGEKVLLMHGDTLCTGDIDYQKFRRFARNRVVQTLYLSLPVSQRRWLAGKARDQSMSSNTQKSEEIMDVEQATVEDVMRQNNTHTVLHGHTHRPAIHKFKLDGENATRLVLGDWYTQGSVLRWDANGPELLTLNYDT